MNEQMINANKEEDALEKQSKEVKDTSQRNKIEKGISDIKKQKIEITKKSQNIKLKKFKNLFRFKTKYTELMGNVENFV